MAQKFGVNDLRGVVAVTPTPALPGAGGSSPGATRSTSRRRTG